MGAKKKKVPRKVTALKIIKTSQKACIPIPLNGKIYFWIVSIVLY